VLRSPAIEVEEGLPYGIDEVELVVLGVKLAGSKKTTVMVLAPVLVLSYAAPPAVRVLVDVVVTYGAGEPTTYVITLEPVMVSV
jgi:hypothetical protein